MYAASVDRVDKQAIVSSVSYYQRIIYNVHSTVNSI